MSIVSSELVLYSSVNEPEDDSTTSGGAIDTTSQPTLVQLTATSAIDYVSDGADTRSVTVTGRDATGAIVTETKSLTGAVTVNGTQLFERVLKVTTSSDASRTATIKQHSNSATICTLGPLAVKSHIQFQRSFSQTAPTVRYEKNFWKNTNSSLTLTSAQITLTADPSSVIQIGLTVALNDSTSVANRLAAPAGVSFSGVGVALNLVGTTLPAASAQGFWAQESLGSNAPAAKSSYTTQLSGNTT